jgi:hypothetical protein
MQRREFLITSAALAGSALSDKALGGGDRRPRIVAEKATERAVPGGGGRFPPNNKIVELMRVPAGLHDLNWLRESLQAAIDIELSALPPYLCAMWSIVTQRGAAYDLIYRVAMEEMLHMGLVCNLLTAIGTSPQIVQGYQERIAYPGPPPGGVRPELTVYLAGLTPDYLKNVFMEIEYPESGPVALALGQTYPTIGAFYSAILEAFQALSPELTTKNQLTSPPPIDLYLIETPEDVETAITQIKEQGEGTSESPLAEHFGGDFAHYYKFAEIFHGSTLIQQNGRWQYAGDPIPFPDVYPMAPIPAGGYENPPEPVVEGLRAFNDQFATVLAKLESAWANGSMSDLGISVGAMFRLRALARNLMQIPLPDKSGVYGPDFRPSLT